MNVMDWIMSSKFLVETITPNVTVFGDMPLTKQLWLNEFIRVDPWSIGVVSFWEKEETPGAYMTEKKAMWGHNEKMTIYKPRQAPGKINPVSILILDFQLQDCEKDNVWSISHPIYGIWGYGSPQAD